MKDVKEERIPSISWDTKPFVPSDVWVPTENWICTTSYNSTCTLMYHVDDIILRYCCCFCCCRTMWPLPLSINAYIHSCICVHKCVSICMNAVHVYIYICKCVETQKLCMIRESKIYNPSVICFYIYKHAPRHQRSLLKCTWSLFPALLCCTPKKDSRRDTYEVMSPPCGMHFLSPPLTHTRIHQISRIQSNYR